MKKGKVIIVEDCKFQGRITRDLLTRNGYETKWVKTSEEALEDNFFNEFDIVILDVILPGMDGYECCRIIKNFTKAVPVIMLTSMEDEGSLIKALNSGADDYIKKPYSKQELIARVNVQIRSSKLQKELIEKNKELQKANELIKNLAITDILTGVNNRAYMPEYINSIVNKSKAENVELSAIMMDIDNFKNINDTYGHMVGDIVLKKLAEICKEEVKDNGIVVRFGGEEFLIILSGTKDMSTAIAENIRKRCEESYPCGFIVTASLGVCTHSVSVTGVLTEFEKCINEADNMLYKSKRTGKNKVTVSIGEEFTV